MNKNLTFHISSKVLISISLVLLIVVLGCQRQDPATDLTAYNTNLAADDGGHRIRLILDTDANSELDDQHAIAYMLFNGDVFDVEGITVNRTRRGGGIDKHIAEAERIVRLCGMQNSLKVLQFYQRITS